MSGSSLGVQVGCGEFDAFNIRGRGDGHLEHGAPFGRVGEVRIRLIQSPFEHGHSIACSEIG